MVKKMKSSPAKPSPLKTSPRMSPKMSPKLSPRMAAAAAPAIAKEPKDLVSLVASMPGDLEFIREGSKVRCKHTRHEMPGVLEVVLTHIRGGKFTRAKEGKCVHEKLDLESYGPHIQQHTSNAKLLFCALTGQTMKKAPAVVAKHVKGKRYLAAVKAQEEEEAVPAATKQRRVKKEGEDYVGPFAKKKKKKRTAEDASSANGEKAAKRAKTEGDASRSEEKEDAAPSGGGVVVKDLKKLQERKEKVRLKNKIKSKEKKMKMKMQEGGKAAVATTTS